MFGNADEPGRRPSILVGTLKVAVVVASLSYFAATWLSTGGLDQHGLSRLAANVTRGVEDPETTGSISRGAAATRLDPCALPRRP